MTPDEKRITPAIATPIRCIKIGKTIVQGPCEIALVHNHQISPKPIRYGTIRIGDDAHSGVLIEQVRHGRSDEENL